MTLATSMSIFVFLRLSVLELGPMYATDRRQTKASLNAPTFSGGGIITKRCSRVSYMILKQTPKEHFVRPQTTQQHHYNTQNMHAKIILSHSNNDNNNVTN